MSGTSRHFRRKGGSFLPTYPVTWAVLPATEQRYENLRLKKTYIDFKKIFFCIDFYTIYS